MASRGDATVSRPLRWCCSGARTGGRAAALAARTHAQHSLAPGRCGRRALPPQHARQAAATIGSPFGFARSCCKPHAVCVCVRVCRWRGKILTTASSRSRPRTSLRSTSVKVSTLSLSTFLGVCSGSATWWAAGPCEGAGQAPRRARLSASAYVSTRNSAPLSGPAHGSTVQCTLTDRTPTRTRAPARAHAYAHAHVHWTATAPRAVASPKTARG